jgi:hypothetical protein
MLKLLARSLFGAALITGPAFAKTAQTTQTNQVMPAESVTDN